MDLNCRLDEARKLEIVRRPILRLATSVRLVAGALDRRRELAISRFGKRRRIAGAEPKTVPLVVIRSRLTKPNT